MMPPQEIQREKDFTTTYNDHEKGLNVYAFFKINNRGISEGLVQDTFMKTWKYLVKGGKIDLMKAFLYHILNNLIVDEYRKHKTTSLDVLREKGFEPTDDKSENLFNFLDGKTAVRLMKHLPARYKKAIQMKYVQDLSLKEISDITGQAKNSIAVQVHRGLTMLKELHALAKISA